MKVTSEDAETTVSLNLMKLTSEDAETTISLNLMKVTSEDAETCRRKKIECDLIYTL